MDSKKAAQEQISALVDGELAPGQIDGTFSALNRVDGRSTWDIYHQIGDTMRSDDMAFSLSPHFASSVFARLEAEPTIISPALFPVPNQRELLAKRGKFAFPAFKRFALPGAAIAASLATVVFMGAPQLMVALRGDTQHGSSTTMIASAGSAVNSREGVILRDPQIDQYLFAHQRFSPAAYSIAQYARPATFDTESDK